MGCSLETWWYASLLAYVIDRRCFRIPNKNKYCISTRFEIDKHNGEVTPCISFQDGRSNTKLKTCKC